MTTINNNYSEIKLILNRILFKIERIESNSGSRQQIEYVEEDFINQFPIKDFSEYLEINNKIAGDANFVSKLVIIHLCS